MDAGVWLVFLAFPVFSVVNADAPWSLKLLGFGGILAFAVLYLFAFVRPQPLESLPLWLNTILYALGLAAVMALAVPAGSYGVLAAAPYFVALWLFTHPLRSGLTGAAVTAAVAGALMLWWAGPANLMWSALALGSAVLIIFSVRFSIFQEDRARVLREELLVSQQRESFARDVHDLLGHSLTVVSIKTELARRLVDADPDRARGELDEVLELARSSLAEVRATVGGLRTPELRAQLASARTALDAAGISARVPAPEAADSVPAGQREVFAWCLREAVTNVIRHAGARHCTVTLEAGRLVVHDDGRGLERDGATDEGNGLAGMRERVEQAGGTLEIGPARPGHTRPGTQVEVRL